MKQALFIGAIASVLTINSVFAVSSTVTSKDYVDATVATKQDEIAGRGTVTNGILIGIPMPASVIADSATDGTVTKRVIIQSNDFMIGSAEQMGTKLASGDLVEQFADDANTLYGLSENDLNSGLVSVEVLDAAFARTAATIIARQKKKTCAGWPDGTTVADATHTDANCVLWNLPD